MCINNNKLLVEKERSKASPLVLWKVVRSSNKIGLWRRTYAERKADFVCPLLKSKSFRIGVNAARPYYQYGRAEPGEFCCLFTREAARLYRKHGVHHGNALKIIKVYVERKDIVHVGTNYVGPGHKHINAIGVSKMEIKSLKHQR